MYGLTRPIFRHHLRRLTQRHRVLLTAAGTSTDGVWFQLAVVLVFATVAVDAVALSPIYWNASNPLFKPGGSSRVIEVNLYDEIDFICPYYETIRHNSLHNSTLPPQPPLEYYVIYQVSRPEYESCRIGTRNVPHLVVNCSNPLRRKRFTILFEFFQAIPNVAEFQPGSTYYYISTSGGQRDSLQSLKLGACYYNNMRLAIHVCCQTNQVEEDTQLGGGPVDIPRDFDYVIPPSRVGSLTFPTVTSLPDDGNRDVILTPSRRADDNENVLAPKYRTMSNHCVACSRISRTVIYTLSLTVAVFCHHLFLVFPTVR